MAEIMNAKQVVGIKCSHVCYTESSLPNSTDDFLLIKEQVKYADDTVVPNLRFVENFKRDFYTTKSGFRNHKDKKLFEDISKVHKHTTTQRLMPLNVAKALRCRYMGIKQMARNQYLYGTDVPSTTIVKRKYLDRFPEVNKEILNTVAVADFESDVLYNDTENLWVDKISAKFISGSITFKNRAFLAVSKEFVAGEPDLLRRIQKAFDKYLGEYKEKRKINLEIELVDSPAQVAIAILQKAHEWKPDFLAFWNMNFDIQAMELVLKNEGYDPAHYFSDPAVPSKYKHFYYNRGNETKVTASGRAMALAPAERWHSVECPASFTIIDAMCVYQKIRIASGKEPSYSLDNILAKHLNLGKLRFKEADHCETALEWHEFMQEYYKVEYLIYNVFDCISVELLDEKLMDLSSTISLLCMESDYAKFPSQPRRTCDRLHFFALEEKHVIASTSDKMEDELDKLVIGTENWVVTLPAHHIIDNGIKCLKEFPDLITLIRVHVADIDVAAAYPNGESLANISHETTYREVSKIEGISDDARRFLGINITGGKNNALEISRELYKQPTLEEMYQAFTESLHTATPVVDYEETLQRTLLDEQPQNGFYPRVDQEPVDRMVHAEMAV